jgi:phospholipid/cholesterol/gamma-HCH transport system substrate-binding protein
MQNSTVETLIGAVVIAVAVLFLFFAYTGSGIGAVSGGYDVVARFDRADGVNVGTDVRLSGIKVGTVDKLTLDPKTYNAVVTIAMENAVKLPDDSSVRITSDGLLGSQYLSIEPGGSMQMIKPGGQIENTQGSIDLIGLLGKFAFSPSTGVPGGGGSGAAPAAGATPAAGAPAAAAAGRGK